MSQLTIFEFDAVTAPGREVSPHDVPQGVYDWLEHLCLNTEAGTPRWLKLTQRGGRRAIQVSSYVGVLRAPCGFQIEVLPKIGKASSQTKAVREHEARTLLIQMLKCLVGFRHIQTLDAELLATRMPLQEVFIQQLLAAVQSVVKRGLRSDYVATQDNLALLRGKLKISEHIRQNIVRRDRFYTEHDLFTPNRPENRLLHSALRVVLALSRSQENQRVARELCFVFDEVPESNNFIQDLQAIRLDRGMSYYEHALDWAKLILSGMSPLTGAGKNRAPSLLFPMEALFEAYVEKHLRKQVITGFNLKSQASSHYLVEHQKQNWFRLKPDLLVYDNQRKNRLLLDTKWKLIDSKKGNGSDKYQLSQADFYQLFAYGHHYLQGSGDVVLVYPKTDTFVEPLPVFRFPKSDEMRLWVLPFCLQSKRLLLPDSLAIAEILTAAI
jgi:5-methylcytosine-specific restriction enzyme subunit McrC